MAKTKIEIQKTQSSKSRAQFVCPPALELIIQKVNSIPNTAVMPEYSMELIFRRKAVTADFRRGAFATYEQTDAALLQAEKDVFNLCFEGFSEKYKEDFIKDCENWAGQHNDSNDIDESLVFSVAFSMYALLKGQHDDLKAIERFFYHLRKNDVQSADDFSLITNSEERFSLPMMKAQLRRDGTSGKINKTFFESLIGLDLDRIRACEICSKIFWAKRSDSETCSARCFGILRTRRYRSLTAEEKAERKVLREANKKQKEKLKKLKENR